MNIFDFLGFRSSDLISIAPFLLTRLGNHFKDKDANATGMDDAGGNLLIAIAPVVPALFDKNENAFRKAMKAIHEATGNYLKSLQS